MVELEIKKKYEKFRLDVAFKSEKSGSESWALPDVGKA